MLSAIPNKSTDLASWINLGPSHFIICICHNTHFSKNSQMIGILCIYSKTLSKWGTFGTFLHQNAIQHCGSLCCLTPQLLPLNHCESCMIHHCSCSSHTCHKCSLHQSILLWCSWGCILKKITNSFLSDSLSRTLFSPAISHLIIFIWILCLAFKAFIQSIIGSTCSFFFFRKKLFLYFVASSTKNHPMLSSSHAWFSH